MEFTNVRLIKKANVYDGGKVSSRTFYTAEGERKTLGFMLPGEYSFSTAAAEVMEMLGGELEALLPGCEQWQSFGPGQSFSIPAQSAFQVKVREFADYCCSYAD